MRGAKDLCAGGLGFVTWNPLRLLASVLVALVISATPVSALLLSHEQNPARPSEVSAVIEWSSDLPATSAVDYGLTTTLGSRAENASFVTQHRIRLEGLAARTKYYFQLVSVAQDGSFRIDDNGGRFYTLTTASTTDFVAPIASNITTELGIEQTSLRWMTNEPASSKVFYGQDGLKDVLADERFIVEHSVSLPTVSGEVARFVIESCDVAGNCANTTERGFLGGGTVASPGINASVPAFVQSPVIVVSGIATPFAEIVVSVNGVRQRVDVVPDSGVFSFRGVRLDKKSNVVLIETRDASGVELSQEFPVTVDATPPKLSLSSFPSFTIQSPLLVTGVVDEPVMIVASAVSMQDVVAPGKVVSVRSSAREGVVVLEWTPSSADDVLGYAVYRDEVRVAVVPSPAFEDASVVSSRQYRYRVSAVDDACNEGVLSDTVTVTSLPSDASASSVPSPAVDLPCARAVSRFEANGAFEFALDLVEGANIVKVVATDAAGNAVVFQNTTVLDVSPPAFEDLNLDRLSPTFIPEVEIKGKVSEQATIFVYLNNKSKPVDVVATKVDGSFTSRVTLSREFRVTKKPKGIEVALDEGFENTVRVEAVDAAGQRVVQGPVSVVLASCGAGGPYQISIGDPQPSELIPRLMLQGLQTVGFTINATYKGGNKATIRRIRVDPVVVSQDAAERYDHDWVRIGAPLYASARKDVAYAQLQFVNVDPLAEKEDATLYDREKALAEHRVGGCGVPGFGCARLLLQVEVEAQEEIPQRYVYSKIDETQGNVTAREIRQRNCVDVMLMIEKPARFTDVAPSKFLNATAKVLGDAVEVIDAVLKPLTSIGTFVLYSCFALTGWLYFQFVSERWECDAKGALSVFDGWFDKRAAEIGMCDAKYADSDGKSNARRRALCNSCSAAIARRQSFEGTYRTVCDRVACPSAPTLQSYIRDRQESDAADSVSIGGNTFYSGSNCGFTGEQSSYPGIGTGYGGKKGELSIEQVGVPGFATVPVFSQSAGTNGIKQVYLDYLKHRDDKKKLPKIPGVQAPYRPGAVNCAGLHPSDPECCGFEYQDQWGSACGIPGVIETFDEIEQSACLAAQNANAKRDFEKEATRVKGSPVQCASVFNAVAGFCDPDKGTQVVDPIPTGIKYATDKKPGSSVDGEVYIHVIPKQDYRREIINYQVWAGPVLNKFAYQKAVSQGKVTGPAAERGKYELDAKENQRYSLQSRLDVLTQTDLKQYFTPPAVQHYQETGQILDEGGFKAKLCTQTAGISTNDCTTQKVRDAYGSVVSVLGISDQEYIVRPDQEGILRSVQCVCLPAVTSYLEFWKGILGAVQRCFQTVLLTGDGSPGVCQAVLSTYVCDLLYDIIRCFTQKYSSPGFGATRGAVGIGNTLAALTGAGSDMAEGIRGRYGKTALWRSLFVERKLLHATCLWAFTGTWNLDVSDIFKQTVQDIPIESQGFLPVANRRYLSFNPATSPRGITTHVYTLGLGLAAGADIRYEVLLKCSNSFKCDPNEGFKDGKCDCFGAKGERTLAVSDPSLSGSLRKNEILDSEVLFPVEDDVRYDKAIIRWEYLDSGGEVVHDEIVKDIKMIGGEAPGFCQFDVFALAYRCEVGIGNYQGARFTRTPTPKYAPNAQAFTLKDPIAFDAEVLMQLPQPSRGRDDCAVNCPFTKYLVMKVKNQLGATLWSNDGKPGSRGNPIPISKDGSNVLVLPPIELKPTKDDFGLIGTRSALDSLGGLPRAIVSQVTSLSVQPTELPAGSALNLVIAVYPADGSKQSRFEVYQTDGTTVDVSGQYVVPTDANRATGKWGYYVKGIKDAPGAVVVQGVIAENKIVFDLKSLNFAGRQMALTLRAPPSDKAELRMFYQPGGFVENCVSFAEKPATWVAEFELRDSQKSAFGGFEEGEQITVDPSSNEEQRRVVPFQVVCAESFGPAAAEPRKCDELKNPQSRSCFCGTDVQYRDLVAAWRAGSREASTIHNCPSGVNDHCVNGACVVKPVEVPVASSDG